MTTDPIPSADDGFVPHSHSEYVTEEQLKGWLARRILVFGFLSSASAFALIVWGVRLEGQTDENRDRIEQVRIEGSLPTQLIRRDIDSLRFEIRSLNRELAETRQALRAR